MSCPTPVADLRPEIQSLIGVAVDIVVADLAEVENVASLTMLETIVETRLSAGIL